MDLQTRLERLERASCRWQTATLLLAVLLGLGLFLGQARPEPREVKAERFVLVDDQGNSRATLAMENGGPSLVLTDSRGKGAIRLQVPKVPDKGAIYLSDAQESADMELAMTQSGPVLHLGDRTGNRVRLATNELNAPLAAVYDAEAKVLWEVKSGK